nr:MAG TPA: hypothetical protein [Caudoviricetes sp.]
MVSQFPYFTLSKKYLPAGTIKSFNLFINYLQ